MLAHIFSFLNTKDIAILPPSKILVPYYQSITYQSILITKLAAFDKFNSTIVDNPSFTGWATKFDLDFRNMSKYNIPDSFVASSTKLIYSMSRLESLALGKNLSNVIDSLSGPLMQLQLPRLRELKIVIQPASNRSFSQILKLVSQIKQLDTLRCEILEMEDDSFSLEMNQELSHISLNHIKTLDIKGSLLFTSIQSFISCFKSVKNLTLHDTSNSFECNDSFSNILPNFHTTIQRLLLHDSGYRMSTQDFIPELSSFKKLEILSIGDVSLLPLTGYANFHELSSSLHTINLGYEAWSTADSRADISQLISGTTRIRSLKNLNLDSRLDRPYKVVKGSRWKDHGADICYNNNARNIVVDSAGILGESVGL